MTLPASIRLALRIICLLPGLALSLPAPAAGQQLLFEDFALDSGAFSPNGDGIQDHLLITVRLNQAGYLRVQVDSSDVPIRTLLDSVAVGTGAVELIWNGTADPAGLDPRLVSEGDYTVKAAAWSGTQSIVADPLDLVLDITAPVHTSTLFVEGDTLVRDGESIQLETTWNGDDYRIRPDFTAVDSDTLGGLQMMESGTTTRFQYTLSFYNTTADADSLPVPITAVDPAGNTAVDTTILLNLHNTPIPLGSVLADSSSCISDEWSIVIKTRWDRDDLSIVPDFAHIDNGLPGPYTVYPEGGGLYTIQYTTSENNTTPDADSLVVGLTASTRFGDRFTDNSLRLTMNNHPPVHIATRLINAKTVFKNSDTLKIETQWSSPGELEINVGADFQGISSRFKDGNEATQQTNDTTFVITYLIPAANEASDAASVLIPVYAQTGGCRREEIRALWIGLDNTAPTIVPVLNPLPSSVTTDQITVAGVVDSLPAVAIFKDGKRVATADVGAGGEFSVPISLTPGPQEIAAAGRDAAGNESGHSAAQTVIYVTAGEVLIPKPFRPGDIMTISHPIGYEHVDARLLNIEGGLVREWRWDQNLNYIEIQWDGRNGDNARVHSGAYLLKWEARFSDGGSEKHIWPILYLR